MTTDRLPTTAERLDAVTDWAELGGFPVRERSDTGLLVDLDRAGSLTISVDVGEDTEPIRLHDRFSVEGGAGLSDEVVEQTVLGRSSMIDARTVGSDGVETVVAVYPDGLDRHRFMTALFELQKVRDLIRRECAVRAVDEATVAELERLLH
ncbi:MAG: hypothetical protein AAGK32_08010 [Actinomycetota bacterium]